MKVQFLKIKRIIMNHFDLIESKIFFARKNQINAIISVICYPAIKQQVLRKMIYTRSHNALFYF